MLGFLMRFLVMSNIGAFLIFMLMLAALMVTGILMVAGVAAAAGGVFDQIEKGFKATFA